MNKKSIVWRLMLCLSVVASVDAVGANNTGVEARILLGDSLFASGEYQQAIGIWKENRELLSNQQIDLMVENQLKIASAYTRLGLYQESLSLLISIENDITQLNNKSAWINWLNVTGNCYLAQGSVDRALNYLGQAVEVATEDPQRLMLPYTLNDYGNAQLIAGYLLEAEESYLRAKSLLGDDGSPLLINININLAKLALQNNNISNASDYLLNADQLIRSGGVTHTTINQLLAMSKIASSIRQVQESPTLFLLSFGWLELLLSESENITDTRTLSYINGYLAELYFQSEQYIEAHQFVAKALEYSQSKQLDDLSYRWQWQQARLLQKQGNVAEAIDVYQRAHTALSKVRFQMTKGYFPTEAVFETNIKAFYNDFVDVLLLSSADQPDYQRTQEILTRARDIVESSRTAELEDYFNDSCSVEQQQQQVKLDEIAGDVAVLYPIILPNRLELLLSIHGKLSRISVDVSGDYLRQNAYQYSTLLQDRYSERFKPYANRLFKWLINPIESQLQQHHIQTLVIVPDTGLYGVPFSAFHDGEHYLVEKYGVAITPSLTLTAPKKIAIDRSKILLAGVSSAVQGYSPLPNIETELSMVRQRLDGKLLLNDSYTTESLVDSLQRTEYSIVHLASHGTFGNTSEDSYLLAYDGNLDMNDLEGLLQVSQFRSNPVELLTLSACESAAGNQKASLGLAGIAIKSGARSALASLWIVDDEATTELMGHFYQLLVKNGFSKSQALRGAQQQLIGDSNKRHPAFWAPFVLIGNWL